jgi:hypothetical protein
MIRQRPVIIDFIFLNTNTEGIGVARILSRRGSQKIYLQIYS